MSPDSALLETDATTLLVEAEWYLRRYPDLAAAGVDAVEHYRLHGGAEGRWPNRAFDPEWYLSQQRDAGEIPVGTNPLEHYVRYGERRGLRPVAWFDPIWYRATYAVPDDEIALAHYLRHHVGDDLVVQAPVPSIDTEADIVASSGLFDPNYYLLNSPDVLEAEIDPARHFCADGWREHRRPNIYFDTKWYGARYLPEDAGNPLLHYFQKGESAGFQPCLHFDPVWYRREYRLEATQCALAHFLAHRESQKFSPTPFFDVGFYVSTYGKSIRPNRDPFIHYLTIGAGKGYDPAPWFSGKAYQERHMTDVPASSEHDALVQLNPLLHLLATKVSR
jgi:hypothetical protein